MGVKNNNFKKILCARGRGGGSGGGEGGTVGQQVELIKQIFVLSFFFFFFFWLKCADFLRREGIYMKKNENFKKSANNSSYEVCSCLVKTQSLVFFCFECLPEKMVLWRW